MSDDKRTIRVTVLKPTADYPEKKTITIEADGDGIPLDPQWRRRLRDAAIDGSVTVEDQDEEATVEDQDQSTNPPLKASKRRNSK